MNLHKSNFLVATGLHLHSSWYAFGDAARDNKASKMPYNTWKLINQTIHCNKDITKSDAWAFLCIRNDVVYLKVIQKTYSSYKTIGVWDFPAGSFDKFVCDTYYNDDNKWTEYDLEKLKMGWDSPLVLEYAKHALPELFADYEKPTSWEATYKGVPLTLEAEPGTTFTMTIADAETKPIISFDAAKEASFTCENAIVNADLLASLADSAILAPPCIDEVSVSIDRLTEATDQLKTTTQTTLENIQNSVVEPSLTEVIQKIVDEVLGDENNTTIDFEKENENMKMFNLDFGPVNDPNVRLSLYGVAIKNASGTWVSYNKVTKEIMDVDVLNFDGKNMVYKIPVAIKDIAVGDCLIHNRKPMIVTNAFGNTITVVDVMAGERKEILPTKSPFGFDFYTKVVSLFDGMNVSADANAPFGNMLPMLMMMDNDNNDDSFALMLMLSGGAGVNMGNIMSNPLMMYALMSGKEDMGKMLPLMMMCAPTVAPGSACVGAEDPKPAATADYYPSYCNIISTTATESTGSDNTNWAPPSR